MQLEEECSSARLERKGLHTEKCSEPGKVTYTLKDKTYGVYEIVADAPAGWFASGTTGDCTWVKEGSVLTISVTDPSVISLDKNMGNYNSKNPAPWKNLGITEVIINDGVTRVGNDAFYECEELESVTISDSVRSIGNSAFYGCTSLTSVNIPNSVRLNIYNSAFSQCESLKSIVIPGSVNKIGLYAFADSGLTSVTIPASVHEIEDYSFYYCYDLKSFTILNPDLFIDWYQNNHTGSSKALGWYYDAVSGYYEKVPDFTIYGYKGSTAEKYANKGDFTFVAIAQRTDSSSNISVIIPEGYSFKANELTGQDEAAAAANLPKGYKAIKAYNLTVSRSGYNMQVNIPCADKDTTVYRKESDGTFTDMKAYYENGYMVFYTDYTGVFVLTKPSKAILGDVDGDEETDVSDATWIQRGVAKMELPFEINTKTADADGDGQVTLMDATCIQRWLVNLRSNDNIGKPVNA